MGIRKRVVKFAVLLALGAMPAPAVASPVTSPYPVPKPCKVPQVVGKKLAKAEKAIKKAHCTVGSVTNQSSPKPKGHVVAQSPPAGSAGPTVNLTVSLGPAPGPKCVVPNVVGEPLATAEGNLVSANCAVGKVKQKRSSLPQGQVIKQSPAAGKSERAGAKVKLTISTGSAKHHKKHHHKKHKKHHKHHKHHHHKKK
jgi:serine/threonine-protein kinase